ncbi:MAG: YfiR family protein [Alphaproteobacteria bacterium]|nr:YfiR family protein [Alphaproteobacteria bacterium]
MIRRHRIAGRRLGRSILALGLVGALAMMLAFAAPARAQEAAAGEPGAAERVREYQIKAAFLYNFAILTEWPEARSDTAFRICVAGANPFGASLRALAGKKVKGRRIVPRQVTNLGEARRCDILFVETAADYGDLLEDLRDAPVLTVSSTPGFTRRGGIIGFTVEGNRLRFEVNLTAARRAGVVLRSRLLRLAKIVAPDDRAGLRGN